LLHRKVGLACDSVVRKRSFSFSSGLACRRLCNRGGAVRTEKNGLPASSLVPRDLDEAERGSCRRVGHLPRRHSLNRRSRTPVDDCSVKVAAILDVRPSPCSAYSQDAQYLQPSLHDASPAALLFTASISLPSNAGLRPVTAASGDHVKRAQPRRI